MPKKTPKTARAIATVVLNKLNLKHNYAAPILNKLLQNTQKSSEKQKATDLVFGTIRNRFAIDFLIAKLADCPPKRIPVKALNIIRIGIYELIYCPQTPEYSIVNEAVKNVKLLTSKKQAGFVNAVLRQITRHIQNRKISLSKAAKEKMLPQTPLTGCQFDISLLPNPKQTPADYFSIAFSLPKWLINNWLTEFTIAEVRQICFASNRKVSIYIRPNKLKTTIAQLSEMLQQENVDFAQSPDKSMLKIKSPAAIAEIPGFAQGLFSAQDITTSQAIKLLNPRPYLKILDLCAAPGGKTTQLAELTDDKAMILATDIDSKRLEKVKENIERLGITSVKIFEYNTLKQIIAEYAPFDAVLLDVPCSNTGVLSRRPEVRYRIRPKIITELAKTQTKLLETALEIVKPQGKICYSTCSIQSDENNHLIRRFLKKNRSLRLKSEKLTIPSAEASGRDGGYVAIIVKK